MAIGSERILSVDMRLLGRDCGCDSRREIIFQAGDIGVPEATILVTALLAVSVSLYLSRRS